MTLALTSDRTVNWLLAGVPSGIPTVATEINAVTQYGARGNGTTNDAPAIQAAIDGCSGNSVTPKAVYLPAGNYLLASPLIFKTGVTLRGAGTKSTFLKFKLGSVGAHCIRVEKQGGGSWIGLASGYTKASTTIVLKAPAASYGFVPGSVVEIRQSNDPAYFPSKWNVSWGDKSVGEIAVVQSVSGSTVVLTRGLHFTYGASFSPEIRTMQTIDSVGLEDLYITRVDQNVTNHGGEDATFYFYQAAKCWMFRVESDHAVIHHMVMSRGYRNEIRRCYFHHADEYGPAHGYGLGPRMHTTLCLFEDNCFSTVTDAYMFETGANGNVFTFSYSELAQHPSGSKWDSDFHGHHPYQNLVEGNKMCGLRVGGNWGPAPRNTLFRNQVYKDKIWILDGSHYCNVIGNELTTPTPVVSADANLLSTCIIHANELGATITYQGVFDHVLPASFVKAGKPTWWNDACPWPCFGPDVTNGKNPAQLRSEANAHVPQPTEVVPPAGGTDFTQTIAPTSQCFKVSFSITPLATTCDYCNALKYSLAPTQASPFAYLATTLRLNSSGFFDARNGGSYAAATVLAYVKDTKYSVRMIVDMLNHTYDAYVGSVPIAIGYSFRAEQAKVTKLDTFIGIATTGTALVENVVILD